MTYLTKCDAILSLVPGASVIERDGVVEWINPKVAPVTNEQIDAEYRRLLEKEPLDKCKKKAKELIAATDWSVLPDVGIDNRTEFETYRASLRGLITNPVANPEWPTEPQPIWSN